jgi:hypothetical protein
MSASAHRLLDRAATARQNDPICAPQQMIAKEPPAAPDRRFHARLYRVG